jgi:hypothetical protein
MPATQRLQVVERAWRYNMDNKKINSLARRGVNYFIATYSPFHPISSQLADEEGQKNAHEFILNIYLKSFEDTSLIGMKDLADDSYDDWVLQKDKPGLDTKIRKYITKIEEYVVFLFDIVLKGVIQGDTIIVPLESIDKSKVFLNKWSNYDVIANKTEESYIFEFPKDTVKGLKLLAEISNSHYENSIYKNSQHVLFSRGCFDSEQGFMREVFMNNINDKEALRRLIEFLEANEYIRIENKTLSYKFAQVSLDYIKFYEENYDKIPFGWGERTHGGIEIIYEEIRKNPVLLTLRIPYFENILKDAEHMDEKVKAFVTTVTKKCDSCGYCIQTDKTGKRPKRYVKVDKYHLCPLFCGFQYRWRNLDEELVENIIVMLKYIDSVMKNK